MIKNDDRFGNPDSPPVMDLVYDGIAFTELYGQRIRTVHTHGTGLSLPRLPQAWPKA